MDICYKKCEFLVEGMKNSFEMNQLKEKMEFNKIIENSKD